MGHFKVKIGTCWGFIPYDLIDGQNPANWLSIGLNPPNAGK